MSRQESRYDEEDIKRIVEASLQKPYSKEVVSATLDSMADSDLIDLTTAREVLDDYVSTPTQPQRAIKKSGLAGIVKGDLKKVGKGIAKYVIGLPIGLNVAFPTTIRKVIKEAKNLEESNKGGSLGALIGATFSLTGLNLFGLCLTYIRLIQTNPKLALTLGLTQIGTNVASGLYEYFRYVKERANH